MNSAEYAIDYDRKYERLRRIKILINFGCLTAALVGVILFFVCGLLEPIVESMFVCLVGAFVVWSLQAFMGMYEQFGASARQDAAFDRVMNATTDEERMELLREWEKWRVIHKDISLRNIRNA